MTPWMGGLQSTPDAPSLDALTRRPPLAALLAGLLLALVPRPAWAWDFTLWERDFALDLTDTLTYSYHADNGNTADVDDDYHQILNTLNLSLSHGDFRLGGRFDLHLFADTAFDRDCGGAEAPSYCSQQQLRFTNSFAAERLFFIVARPEFDLTLGDYYVSFGKGIALNVVKIDELGQDTTLRGGKFVLHHADLELTFVGGTFNPLDLDEATGFQAPWPSEPLIGGRLEYRFLDTLLAGVHGVYIISDNPNVLGSPDGGTDANTIFGGGLELPSLWDGRLSLGAEVDLQRTVQGGQVIRGPGAEGDDLTGLAAYAAGTLMLGDLTLIGEFKHYDDFVVQAPADPFEPYTLVYSQPPTLERITAEISDNTEISGGRLRADYNVGQLGPLELMVFANLGYFESWAGDRHSIWDPHGGLELSWQTGRGHLTVSSGVRREQNDDTDQLYRRDIFLELDAEQPLAARHSLKLSALYQERLKAQFGETRWRELDAVLSYKWSPHLALALTYERQEDPAIVKARQTRDPLLGAENYLGGAVQYFLTSGSYATLRVGQSRPGIKCINGVCRRYPAFSGAQLGLVGRF